MTSQGKLIRGLKSLQNQGINLDGLLAEDKILQIAQLLTRNGVSQADLQRASGLKSSDQGDVSRFMNGMNRRSFLSAFVPL